ncbi:MAG: HNH endonuclease [Verrucomicrobiales bacterium]|nr:HNH endonuclease [Verrucomicrobiales bacterium]
MVEPDQNWEYWLERLYDLRRDKRGSHERPHKPVLILSILDLLDRGIIQQNEVRLSEELIETFKRYFAVVRRSNDQPTIQNPFYHLSGDGFWKLVPLPGHPQPYQPGATSGSPSVAQLRQRVSHGRFEEGFWTLAATPVSRHQLREALIARYFPESREKLAAIVVQGPSNEPNLALREKLPPTPARDAAFRRTVLEIYDHRCAACGIRVLLDHTMSLVEAAHLIPFGESLNDKPTNGIALCPNHHWAMDRHLIAPCPDDQHRAGIWEINGKRLDDRIEGQRDLITLKGKRVIAPKEAKFYPALESLRWRSEHLVTKYL